VVVVVVVVMVVMIVVMVMVVVLVLLLLLRLSSRDDHISVTNKPDAIPVTKSTERRHTLLNELYPLKQT